MIEELSDFKYIKYDKLYIYDLLDKGNAEVFKGKYKENEIAIKKYEYSDFDIETLSKELRIGCNVESKRLMKTYGYSYDKKKEYLYLIMEYINSKDLWNYMGTYFDDGYIYSMPKVVKYSIIHSMLKAIRDMWFEDIVHGDLKLLNFVVQKCEKELYIKVIDYGTCEYDYRNKGINKGYVCSTDGYISPELDNTCVISHKSDIYAIGVIIAEIWCGYIRADEDYKKSRNILLKNLRNIKEENKELEKIIRKCIELDPNKRPDINKLIEMFNKLS